MNREIKERTKWFMDSRFGMFIHWGLYSIPACGEWVMSQKEMTIEEYRKYFEQFDPVDYDPKTWVRLAKEAGMKYVVLTAKHHDGFCLFDSKLTDYKATNTKAGRDLVREFVDACREEGLKVGLYFSIIDWHHPDFPKYGDRQHPMRNNVAYKDEKIDLFIDDQLNNCLDIAKIGIKTIRLSNDKKKYKDIITFENWDEIYNYITEME